MGEETESKRIASRIDIRYIDRPNWLQWWRRWIVMLTLAAMAAWAGWAIFSAKSGGRAERMLNPGPVTIAHARFENACSACHGFQPGGAQSGGFSKAVTDAACLNCHDAGSHHPMAMLHPGQSNQIQLTNAREPTKAANCVACHIEHRGHDALVGRDDRLCLQCHQDLSAHRAGAGSAGFAASIGAFPAGHPEFGRRMVQAGVMLPMSKAAGRSATTAATEPKAADEAWVANLALKFNHRTHVGAESSAKIESCASCHSTTAQAVGKVNELPLERQNPPQSELTRGGGDGRKLTAREGGVMQPVRYEQHCRSCHPIGLPITADLKLTTLSMGSKGPATKTSLPVVAHERMEMVRAQLADIDRLYLNLLTELPDGRALLVDPVTHKPRAVSDWILEQRMQLAARLVADGAKEFFPADLQKLAKAQAKLAVEMKKKKPSQDTVDDLTDEIEKALPKVREAVRNLPLSTFQAAGEKAVTMLNNEGNCAKCHYTQGQVMDGAQFKASIGEGTGKAFSTLATGGDGRPRHWFEGARFDHDKHRDMSCLDCHAGMDRDEDGKVKNDAGVVVANHVLRMPGLATCAACHTPDTALARGAGSGCITCHAFHDRAGERETAGMLWDLPAANRGIRFSERASGRATSQPAPQGSH
jgi:predicted CXXCH cytochrome family protein